jgi:hypothetical protein
MIFSPFIPHAVISATEDYPFKSRICTVRHITELSREDKIMTVYDNIKSISMITAILPPADDNTKCYNPAR